LLSLFADLAYGSLDALRQGGGFLLFAAPPAILVTIIGTISTITIIIIIIIIIIILIMLFCLSLQIWLMRA
jgi:hypothetical protein